jgi:hypothetical protein
MYVAALMKHTLRGIQHTVGGNTTENQSESLCDRRSVGRSVRLGIDPPWGS